MSGVRRRSSGPPRISAARRRGCLSAACGGSRACGSCRPTIPISSMSRSAHDPPRLLNGPDGQACCNPVAGGFRHQNLLPHFYLFAPIVYGLEMLMAVSLILDLFVRLGGVIGPLEIVNFWLRLYSAPNEWPSTCFSCCY